MNYKISSTHRKSHLATNHEVQKEHYCIEGDWSSELKGADQIINALQFLRDNSKIDFYRKDRSTEDEFRERLEAALKKTNAKYKILYFAFHGEREKLNLGSKRKQVTLEEGCWYEYN